jgi:hypothetical protein
MKQSWLPPELVNEQPYSMCPVFRFDCQVVLPTRTIRLTTPAIGGARVLDNPDILIRMMWAPTRQLRRDARNAGLPGVWRRKVPGLAEALERSGLVAKTAAA